MRADKRRTMTTLLLIGMIGVRPALAEAPAPKAAKLVERKSAAAREPRLPAFTPEREAAARTFVKLHHPELEDLLDRLKKSQTQHYQRAIRELFQTSETLTDLAAKDARRHALALEAWKLKSRADLLTAQARRTQSQSARDELKEIVAKQIDVQIRQHELDRERAAQRVKALDASIERLRAQREAQVDARVKQLTRRAARSDKASSEADATNPGEAAKNSAPDASLEQSKEPKGSPP